jgi:hypothetical protein
MRNLLEASSVAQSLDGWPSDGEPAFPRGTKAGILQKFPSRGRTMAYNQVAQISDTNPFKSPERRGCRREFLAFSLVRAQVAQAQH